MTGVVRRVVLGVAGSVVFIMSAYLVGVHAICPSQRAPTMQELAADFVFDATEIASSPRVAILIPGVLNSISIFEGARALRERGFALAFYRFPGMDGRPLDRRVEVLSVAQEVSAFAAHHADKQIYLVGFSLGGQIALEAAALMRERVRRVAVLAGSAGFPETLAVGWRATRWIATRAWSLGTLDFPALWREFYKVLLFGETAVADPAVSARGDQIIAARRGRIVTPTAALACAHMADIAWRKAVSPRRVFTPVGFFHGEHDVVSTVAEARAYSDTFPRKSFEVLRGQGHLIFLTAPRLFDDVADFFSDN